MLKTLDLLKPSTVINLLAEKITKENVMADLKNHEVVAEIDPVQPIVDIINIALERNDYKTFRNGLAAITNSTNKILQENQFKRWEERNVTFHIIIQLKKIGIQAANKKNEDSMRLVINNLEKIGSVSVKNYEDTVINIIQTLFILGDSAFEHKFRLIQQQIIIFLQYIGMETTNETIVTNIQQELKKMRIMAIKQNLNHTVLDVESALKRLKNKAEENNCKEF